MRREKFRNGKSLSFNDAALVSPVHSFGSCDLELRTRSTERTAQAIATGDKQPGRNAAAIPKRNRRTRHFD